MMGWGGRGSGGWSGDGGCGLEVGERHQGGKKQGTERENRQLLFLGTFVLGRG